MFRAVIDAYDRIEASRPLVRPTYNQFEIDYLPPFGDPEVNIPGELTLYVTVGLAVNAAIEYAER